MKARGKSLLCSVVVMAIFVGFGTLAITIVAGFFRAAEPGKALLAVFLAAVFYHLWDRVFGLVERFFRLVNGVLHKRR